MRFIPTWFHGIVDYLTVGTLAVVPRILGWNKPATTALTVASGGLLTYSMLTRYQLGLIKVLPMPVHLTLDAMSGVALCSAPFLIPASKKQRPALLIGFLSFGVMELFFALFTKTQPEVPLSDVIDSVEFRSESLQEQLS